MTHKLTNDLTIDVEDYFQVAAFEDISQPESWNSMDFRAEKNTNCILAILERHQVKATFFIVGWIAEKCPELVKKIAAAGHEVGCHSYRHRKI